MPKRFQGTPNIESLKFYTGARAYGTDSRIYGPIESSGLQGSWGGLALAIPWFVPSDLIINRLGIHRLLTYSTYYYGIYDDQDCFPGRLLNQYGLSASIYDFFWATFPTTALKKNRLYWVAVNGVAGYTNDRPEQPIIMGHNTLGGVAIMGYKISPQTGSLPATFPTDASPYFYGESSNRFPAIGFGYA